MLITPTELRSAFPTIDRGITDDRLNGIIDRAELYILKRCMGDEAYMGLLSLENTSPILVGGAYTDVTGKAYFLAGIRKALIHLSYAELLVENIVSTTFGTVKKKDDYSEAADPFLLAKRMQAVGLQYIREVCSATGVKYIKIETLENE